MPMTVLITRDVADRFRGFAASIMPEVAPGVFVAADLSRGVRERMWNVLAGWWDGMPGGSILLVWRDDNAAGRLGIQSLGLPVRTLADLDGVLLVNNF
jgi:CRISPR-associated protein Cas2